MSIVHFIRIDPSHNIQRFYRLDVQRKAASVFRLMWLFHLPPSLDSSLGSEMRLATSAASAAASQHLGELARLF